MTSSRFSTFRRLRGVAAFGVIAVGVASLLPVSPASSAPTVLRTGDNFRLGSEEFPFRVKTAPGLAVNPANPNHIVAVMFELGAEECQYAVTEDGGATWDGPKNLVAPAGFFQEGDQPCTVLGHGANGMDSGVAFGNHGVYTTWATDGVNDNDNQSALVSRSTDGGHTFPVGTVAMDGGNPPEPDYRFPKLLVIPGGGAGGADKLIVSADNNRLNETTHAMAGNLDVVISEDNGATWTDPIQVNKVVDTRTTIDDGAGNQVPNPAYEAYGATEGTQPVAVGSDLYLAWRTTIKQVLNPTTGLTSSIPSSNPDFPKGLLRVAKSSDGGLSWTQSDVIGVEGYVFSGPGGIAPYGGAPGTTVTTRFGGSSFPRLAGGNGNVYLTWAQHTGWYNNSGAVAAQDHFQIQTSAVWFSKASNPSGPASWSTPLQVNRSPISPASEKFSPKLGEDPRTANQTTTINANGPSGSFNDPIENHQNDTQTRHPNISVAPDGRVDLVWHDRRHAYKGCSHTHVACDEMRLGDTYYSYSTDGGATWSPNRRVTDRSMNNDVGYDYKFSTYWDYGPVSLPIGNSTVLFAWMDSREGNFDTDAQDIYLSKLNLNDAGSPAVKSLGSGQAGNLSAALSRAANPGGNEGRLAGTFSSRGATYVTIAKAGDQAAILAGGVLARANAGPLLLSATGALLPPEIKAEVSRMAPLGAILIGDTKVLSKQVETDLAALGVPVTRITGTGATLSKNIATAMDRRTATAKTAGLPAFDAAVIALSSGPDAVAASTLAANRRLPVLYVDKRGVPADTSAALASLNINKTLVIGGPTQVSDAVMASLPNPTRLGGANQYETSKAVLQASATEWGLPRNNVFVANGSQPQHGALLGPASARIGGLMLLTPKGTAAEAKAVLDSMGLTNGVDRILTSTLSG